MSTDNIHVHPEYKIYRRSASKSSLRTVLSSVSSKLRSGSEHFWGSLFSLSPDDQGVSSSRHKLVHYLARRYADLLRQRQHLNPPSTPVAAHSAAVGARIANANDASDYTLIKHCPRITPVSQRRFLFQFTKLRYKNLLSQAELLFDFAFGFIVFQIDCFSGFQNDVVRNSGIDSRRRHANDDAGFRRFGE